MSSDPFTHRIAVNAFLLYKDKFLLLKRANKPLLWGPPGGKLQIDEDPIVGLRREVREETNLQVNVFQPVTTWFGSFDDISLLSIDYLCTSEKNTVILSSEHTDYRWLSFNDLNKDTDIYLSYDLGFKLSDFKLAWQTYCMNKNL